MVDGLAALLHGIGVFWSRRGFCLEKATFLFLLLAWTRVEVEESMVFFFLDCLLLYVLNTIAGKEGDKGIPLLAVYYFAHIRTLLDVAFYSAVILILGFF